MVISLLTRFSIYLHGSHLHGRIFWGAWQVKAKGDSWAVEGSREEDEAPRLDCCSSDWVEFAVFLCSSPNHDSSAKGFEVDVFICSFPNHDSWAKDFEFAAFLCSSPNHNSSAKDFEFVVFLCSSPNHNSSAKDLEFAVFLCSFLNHDSWAKDFKFVVYPTWIRRWTHDARQHLCVGLFARLHVCTFHKS